MSAFAALKKARSNNLNSLTNKLDNMGQKYSDPDEHKYWQPTVDKSGNGFATIRFLEAPEGEDDKFVELYTHAFKGETTGKWYIENCLSTIGQDDPVNMYNSKLWNSGDEELKEQVRKQKRKLNYIANVLIVSDPANPENEGKVFLYKFGKKIFDKIKDAAKPEFDDETPINPFDLWEGANFRVKIRKVEGYRNYDKSEFDQNTSPIAETDEEIEAIWKQCHSLKEVVAPSKFKAFDVLQKHLNTVLGLEGGTKTPDASDKAEDEIDVGALTKSADPDESPVKETTVREKEVSIDDDDDDIAFFQQLTQG